MKDDQIPRRMIQQNQDPFSGRPYFVRFANKAFFISFHFWGRVPETRNRQLGEPLLPSLDKWKNNGHSWSRDDANRNTKDVQRGGGGKLYEKQPSTVTTLKENIK